MGAIIAKEKKLKISHVIERFDITTNNEGNKSPEDPRRKEGKTQKKK